MTYEGNASTAVLDSAHDNKVLIQLAVQAIKAYAGDPSREAAAELLDRWPGRAGLRDYDVVQVLGHFERGDAPTVAGFDWLPETHPLTVGR